MNCFNCGKCSCFKTVVRSFAAFLLVITVAVCATFLINPSYWGARGWYLERSVRAIFGPDRFSEDGMAGGLVMMAWADAGYPQKFRVIALPDIGRYVGRIIYEWENKNGQTIRRDKCFHIRWDYSYVPENPAPTVRSDDLMIQGATHPDKTEFDE
jgi:hypothetical protein